MEVSPELLKYLNASLQIATESYAGYAAVLCVIIAVCFYFISVRTDGFRPTNLAAYLFTLLFFGALSYAAFSSLKSVKQLFYAGYDANGAFNVGSFSKSSDVVWEDAALAVVPPQGSGEALQANPQLYDYCYMSNAKADDHDRMILMRFPQPCSAPPASTPAAGSPDRPVMIEIDLGRRRISWVRDDGVRVLLYQIIAIL
jgi:hypothetical protein